MMKKTKPDWAFRIRGVFVPKLSSRKADAFLNQLIAFIEPRNMGVGGSVSPQSFDFIVTGLTKTKEITNEDRRALTAWLQDKSYIARFSVSRLKDANDGNAF